jgi:hypothetical protein
VSVRSLPSVQRSKGSQLGAAAYRSICQIDCCLSTLRTGHGQQQAVLSTLRCAHSYNRGRRSVATSEHGLSRQGWWRLCADGPVEPAHVRAHRDDVQRSANLDPVVGRLLDLRRRGGACTAQ